MEGLGNLIELPWWWGFVFPIIAPTITALIKKLLPVVREKVNQLPPRLAEAIWPIISAAIASLIALLGLEGIDIPTLVAAASMGFSGAKLRDIAVGRKSEKTA